MNQEVAGRVVHQQIDTTELLQRPGDALVYRVAVAHVQLHGEGAAPQRAKLGDGGLQVLAAPAGQDQVGAMPGEGVGDAAADAGAAPRHESYLTR